MWGFDIIILTLEVTMKKLIFIFCLLFAIPAHSFQTIRAQNTSYSSTIQQINYTVTCKRPSRSLFNSKKRYVRTFANKYKKKTLDKHLHRVIFCKNMRTRQKNFYMSIMFLCCHLMKICLNKDNFSQKKKKWAKWLVVEKCYEKPFFMAVNQHTTFNTEIFV